MSESATPSISNESMGAPSGKLDKVGIAASLACAIHCLAAPFLLLLLPAAGSVWSHPAVHWVLAALVLPLALYVIYRGYIRHKRRAALVFAVLGAAFIIAGLLAPDTVAQVGLETAAAATDPGSPGAESPEVSEAGVPGADHEAVNCPKSCCPSLTQDPDTGKFTLNFPPASIATMIGSVLLVLGHAINLHGCHLFNKGRNPAAGDCGCPTACDGGS